MKKEKFVFDKNIDLLQELRLIQAIAESEYQISVRPSEKHKFSPLEKKFGFLIGAKVKEGISLQEHIQLDHKTPETLLGEISKTLIFPHEIVHYCKTLWPPERKVTYSFTGWMSTKRKKELEKWTKDKLHIHKTIHSHKEFLPKLREKISRSLGLSKPIPHNNKLAINNSGKGRKFPDKAWDEQYYLSMANSKFVLCPQGNSVWTYRFFEAILCGAIPVVEKSCEAYNGFTYFSFDDAIKNMQWDHRIAVSNYELCRKRITIDPEILNIELKNIIEHQIK